MLGYHQTLDKLSRQSVRKRFDAYRDVDWDHPDHRIDHEDPCWERSPDDPLGGTPWYRGLSPALRARLGLHLIARQMKLGVQFEAILAQGLLAFASTLPDGAREFRYAYHELIEEAQHSLMFHEFLKRTGLPVRGISGVRERLSRRVPELGRSSPELFFIHVLAGEGPIDVVQRATLREDRDRLHPLLRRIMRIHVLEEARHLCFAEQYLREHLPRVRPLRRAWLRIAAPVTLRTTAFEMMHLPAEIVRRYRIPREVRRAYARHPETRGRMLCGLESVRQICVEHGIVTQATVPVWRALGIWPDDPPPLLAAGVGVTSSPG